MPEPASSPSNQHEEASANAESPHEHRDELLVELAHNALAANSRLHRESLEVLGSKLMDARRVNARLNLLLSQKVAELSKLREEKLAVEKREKAVTDVLMRIAPVSAAVGNLFATSPPTDGQAFTTWQLQKLADVLDAYRPLAPIDRELESSAASPHPAEARAAAAGPGDGAAR